jgi:hypothetical protein
VGSVLLAAVLVVWAAVVPTAAPAGPVDATGQTTPDGADKLNDGIAGPVSVPDDGTLQRGSELKYHDTGKGTVRDQRTGLEWEKKCAACGTLHDVDNIYVWSGDGLTEETIWDWLDQVNGENGGKGYANHSDWRIPNIKELESLVNYELLGPAIAPVFGPTALDHYWSSTTAANGATFAWVVHFDRGDKSTFQKDAAIFAVRAVRGGAK